VSKELLFAAVVITLLGCNSEPTPGPTERIVTITNGIIPGPGALWVFATDEQGTLLSEAQIGPGQTVVLFGFVSPDSVDISVHHALQFSGNWSHTIQTYRRVERGRKIVLTQSGASETPPHADVVDYEVLNYDPNANPYTGVIISSGWETAFEYGPNDTDGKGSIRLYESSSNILVSAHKSLGQPVYKWYDRIIPGKVTVDFNQLVPFDKTIELPATDNLLAYVYGYPQANTTKAFTLAHLSYNRSSSETSVPRLGYLEGFPQYHTTIQYTLNEEMFFRTIGRSTTGTAVSSMGSVPSATIQLLDTEFANFSSSFQGAATFQQHSWFFADEDESLSWVIYSERDFRNKISKLPKELASVFPSLHLDSLEYTASGFYMFQSPYSYTQFLEDSWSGKFDVLFSYDHDYYLTLYRPR
jgi:hypothetical protein